MLIYRVNKKYYIRLITNNNIYKSRVRNIDYLELRDYLILSANYRRN
jgi:hypothetical protein